LGDDDRRQDWLDRPGAGHFDDGAFAVGGLEFTFQEAAFAIEQHEGVAPAGAQAADQVGALFGG